jgi:hypothetical protein
MASMGHQRLLLAPMEHRRHLDWRQGVIDAIRLILTVG